MMTFIIVLVVFIHHTKIASVSDTERTNKKYYIETILLNIKTYIIKNVTFLIGMDIVRQSGLRNKLIAECYKNMSRSDVFEYEEGYTMIYVSSTIKMYIQITYLLFINNT